MKFTFTSVALVAALAGCASTPEGLKSNPENRHATVVQVPYQLAFKRITETQRECAPVQLVPIGQVINDARLYPDLKMGTLTLGAYGIGTQIHQHMEISAKGDASTELVLFASSWGKANIDRYARWATGNFACHV